jgi:tetratricopeptide (TPR) repeat protein
MFFGWLFCMACIVFTSIGQPLLGSLVKATFFSAIYLRGWAKAQLVPEHIGHRFLSHYGKPSGLLFNPMSALICRWLAELLIWVSCIWLVFNHYSPSWLWIGLASVGSWWLSASFVQDRRRNDERKYGWITCEAQDLRLKERQAEEVDFEQRMTQRITENPNDAEAYTKRGDSRVRASNFQGAIDDFTEAIRLDPNNEAMLDGLGGHPTNAMLYASRGLTRLQLGDHDGAIEDCTQSIKIFPDNPLAYIWRSQAYQQAGERRKAQKDISLAKEIETKLMKEMPTD